MRQVMMMMIAMVMIIVMMIVMVMIIGMMMVMAMVMIIVMMMVIVMVIMSNYAKCPANGSERKSFGADQSNPERGGRGEKYFHCK